MSAKVEYGLLFDGEFILKHEIGGWYCGRTDFLPHLFKAVSNLLGWGWQESDEKLHKGAVLVAPLILLVWGEEDDSDRQ